MQEVIQPDAEKTGSRDSRSDAGQASAAQLKYLVQGKGQPGGKLPLFDERGQEISLSTIRSCIKHGWAEPWFDNPIKRGWLVCRLTPAGRALIEDAGRG